MSMLFVSYSLISFNFYLFYFPGAAAESLGSARGALRAPRSTGWEPLSYSMHCTKQNPSSENAVSTQEILFLPYGTGKFNTHITTSTIQ